MRYSLRQIFFTCSLFLTVASAASVTSAASPPTAGDLIKASSQSVYYLAANGKRYVFPNETTFKSWFADFSTVKTITDTELAAIFIGGNVTIRPGTRLVKVTTDPKVYAISHGGFLRWVKTEELARTLFGADWAKQVADIPDAFFTNYRSGADIYSASDYLPNAELTSSPTIDYDKSLFGEITPTTTTQLPTPPVATSTAPVTSPAPVTTSTSLATITASKTNPRPGDSVLLTGTASPSGMLQRLRVFFDGLIYRTCEFTPCVTEITIPTSNVKAAYALSAEATWLDNHQASSSLSLPIDSTSNSGITLTISRTEVRPNTYREFVANADATFSTKYIDIYLDGLVVKGCTDLNQCRYSELESSPTGTVHSVYAVARNTLGEQRRSATKTFSVVDNSRPVVTVTPAKTQLFVGETLDVTVDAGDDEMVARTEIRQGSQILKSCTASTCTVTTGPWNQAQSLTFTATAWDAAGLAGFATSTPANVENPR